MRIENLKSEIGGERARASALVVWEDCDRAPREVYFEVPHQFAQGLSCDPHAFLVGCLLPAVRHGEERIAIDDTICPELRNGLLTAMAWLRHWHGSAWKPVRIEAKAGTRLPLECHDARAGAFLSGGVDSLATLRANRLEFPADHPGSIKDCLMVCGFDIGGTETDGEPEVFGRALAATSDAVANAAVTLIPVFTNIRHLDSDVQFWIDQFFGAALASAAHAISGRLTTAYIAGGQDIPNMVPVGSHPLLLPNLSTASLRIQYDGERLSRLDKVRLLADWEAALQNLRVCTMNPAGILNCGECEKCIRTMTELVAVGKLAHTRAFPADDVSAEMLETVTISASYAACCYRELLDPLAAAGRLDLVRVIQQKLRDFDKRLAWVEERDWKGAVKRLDRRYLGSSLFNTYKAVRERSKAL